MYADNKGNIGYYHAVNLDRLMNEKAPIGRKDLEDIIHEIADAQLEAFAMKGYFLEALEDVNDPQMMRTKELLADWNNLRSDKDKDGYYDSVGITIFEEWWPIVNENVFADELGPFWDDWYNYGGLLYNYAGYSFFVRTIIGDNAAVPVKNDYYNGREWKTVFLESMGQAIANLTEKYGTSDMDEWTKEIKMMPFPSTVIVGAPSSFGKSIWTEVVKII